MYTLTRYSFNTMPNRSAGHPRRDFPPVCACRSLTGISRWLFLVVVLLLTGPLLAHAEPRSIPYQVVVEGLPDEMQKRFERLSDLYGRTDQPPLSRVQLERRAQRDRKQLIALLESLGYFQADVKIRLTGQDPVAVTLSADTGPRFLLDQQELTIVPENAAVRSLLQAALLPPGDPYDATQVLQVEQRLIQQLKESGYPEPKLEDREVVADHRQQQVRVRWEVSTGESARFGPFTIDGLKRVDAAVVRRNLAWTTGDPFDIRQVDASLTALIDTRLFRTVQVLPQPVQGDEVPIRIRVREAKRRSVRAGISYASDEGFGASLGWEHRNLFGTGETLRLQLSGSQLRQGFEATLVRPATLHPDQSLILSARLRNEETDAFDSFSQQFSAVLERTVTPNLKLGGGLAYRRAEITDDGEERLFNLFSVPASLDYSTSDDRLEPTKGLGVSLDLEPFVDLGGEGVAFVRTVIEGRQYLPLWKDGRLVLALRERLALLQGASRGGVPEDLLLYAGGGGSVRGYAFQEAGDLDDDNDPAGGLSAVDGTAELRLRVSETIGVAAFVDVGRAYADNLPDPTQDLFWGVGAGLRYYTPIGPLRLDLAVPLDRRDSDSAFQLYVSFGQAF